MYYAVRIARTGRYVNWCDERWYGTCPDGTPKYTHDEAVAIADQMKHHYVYDLYIVGSDGSEESVCHLPSLKRKRAIKAAIKRQTENPEKKSLFKLGSSLSFSGIKLKGVKK